MLITGKISLDIEYSIKLSKRRSRRFYMDQELLERLELIERMVSQGRSTTQYWGWSFVLWGAGQLIALGWSLFLGHSEIAWPVTMTTCGILTGIGSARMRKQEGAETIISRALGSIWGSCGTAIFFLG